MNNSDSKQDTTLPVLYSFRRCPFAIRARMALHYAGIEVELREVQLWNKPAAMLAASAKATVPVLVLANGEVIDESVDIMRWALKHNDPDHWWRDDLSDSALALAERCDFEFKPHLDHYKYADRFPEHSASFYRQAAETYLYDLEKRLAKRQYLLEHHPTFPDIAIFPFIRQFAMVDKPWFDQAPYPGLQNWLKSLLDSVLFSSVMTKYPPWQETASNE